jgi:hypothetical protein
VRKRGETVRKNRTDEMVEEKKREKKRRDESIVIRAVKMRAGISITERQINARIEKKAGRH